jgi:broad specificity phosphatase PhoE
VRAAYVSRVAELPSIVLLVRHGATEWSVTGQHTGRTDLPLTALGVSQAQSVRPVLERLLEGESPLVFTSPLQRATQTAALALPGLEPIVTESLIEVDYGQYEGLRPAEISERDPNWNLFLHGCPGGETPDQFAARCDVFRDLVHERAPGRPVVAFTHGHLSRVLTVRLLGFEPTAAMALYNDTASVGVISEHRGRWVLDGWNIR